MLDFQCFATFSSTAQVRFLFSFHSNSPKSFPKSPWKILIFFVFLPAKSPLLPLPPVLNQKSPPSSLPFSLSIFVFLLPLFPFGFLALFSYSTLKFQSLLLLLSLYEKLTQLYIFFFFSKTSPYPLQLLQFSFFPKSHSPSDHFL